MSIDADAHLTNAQTIKQLIRRLRTYKLSILSPMITQPGKLFSNFWGAVQGRLCLNYNVTMRSVKANGFYERSGDYVEIVDRKRRAYWNVPFVNSVYLIERQKLKELREAFSFDRQIDPDMSFARYCRQNVINMFTSCENFNPSATFHVY